MEKFQKKYQQLLNRYDRNIEILKFRQNMKCIKSKCACGYI